MISQLVRPDIKDRTKTEVLSFENSAKKREEAQSVIQAANLNITLTTEPAIDPIKVERRKQIDAKLAELKGKQK